jgi:hypothetical protein
MSRFCKIKAGSGYRIVHDGRESGLRPSADHAGLTLRNASDPP